jgi:hypothetical protein
MHPSAVIDKAIAERGAVSETTAIVEKRVGIRIASEQTVTGD